MASQNKTRDPVGNGGNEEDGDMVLTDYDRNRKRVPPVRGRSIVVNTKILSTELTCPICLDLLTTTMTTKECLHRFCSECISMALLRGNKECPTCRTKLVSKRSLRHDTKFDELIKKIWPDRHKYEEMLAQANQDGDDVLSSMVAFVDEDDAKKPSSSTYDPFDKDAPTPPALLDSRPSGTTSPMSEEISGRRTPPWFKPGCIRPRELSKRDRKLYMQAQRAYLKLKKQRLTAGLRGLSRIFESEATETYSKTSRESSPPHEPYAKKAKTNNGNAKKVYAKSVASSADSAQESDSDHESASIIIELDRDDMEELDWMDGATFTINATKRKRIRKRKRERSSKGSEKATCATQPQASSDSLPEKRNGKCADFDIRGNVDPPYPENPEQFAELMPTGKGATWQTMPDAQPDVAQNEEDLDEELVFDEDDVLSAVTIDDLLNEMDEADREKEVEALYHERKGSMFADLSKEVPEDRDKYMCDESRANLQELNELRLGSLADIKPCLDDSEQFEMGETVTWYSQHKDGEELLYYEKGKQPISRGRRRTTAVYNMEEEMERLGRRITMKEIREDMSNTESEHGTPHSFSLVSSPPSSKITVSECNADDEEEKDVRRHQEQTLSPSGAPVPVPLPPLNPTVNKERLHRWLGEIPNHPSTPESMDHLDRRTNEEEDLEDCESLPDNYEIEAELRPAAALLTRNVPHEVVQTRFIRTQHNTTLEHIGEFLYQRWLEEVHHRTNAFDMAPDVPRPEYFYVFNRADRHCKCVFIHEPLGTAQLLTAREDHVVIYFDTQRVVLSAQEMSLLEKIVPQKDRTEKPRSSAGSTTSS